MTMLDCRGQAVPQVGAALIARYNAARPGERYAALVDDWSPGLRMWLLEAGARVDATRGESGWQLDVQRSGSPAQGTMGGVHHLAVRGRRLWVAERGRRVACIDLDTREVARCATVATKASHLALSSDGRRLALADPGANELLVMDAATLTVQARIDAPGQQQLPLVTDDGIVCVTGGGTGTLTIARPTAEGYAGETISVGRAPHDPLLSADGRHVWVPCAGSSEVVKVRLADGDIVGRLAVGEGASHLAGDPHTGRLYAANSWDGTVSAFTDDGELLATLPSGRWCHAIDITPDGRRLWTANFYDDTLAVFDTAALRRRAVVPSERYAHGLDAAPAGDCIVATGFSGDSVQVRAADDGRLIARIPVGTGSSHTAFDEAGHAYVGCSVSAHVAVVDLAAARCVATIRLPEE